MSEGKATPDWKLRALELMVQTAILFGGGAWWASGIEQRAMQHERDIGELKQSLAATAASQERLTRLEVLVDAQKDLIHKLEQIVLHIEADKKSGKRL